MSTSASSPESAPTIAPDQFFAADLRVGRVIAADPFPEARKPAIKLRIDFGAFGIRRSSAQLTLHYQPEELVGRLVVAVVNFPPRQIGPFISEVLVLGACPTPGDVVLLAPDADVPNGTSASGASSTTSPGVGHAPSTRTSEMNGPI